MKIRSQTDPGNLRMLLEVPWIEKKSKKENASVLGVVDFQQTCNTKANAENRESTVEFTHALSLNALPVPLPATGFCLKRL